MIRWVLASNSANYEKSEKYRYLRYIIGNGLVANEGESWSRQRRLVQPAFRRDRLDIALEITLEETDLAIRSIVSTRPAAVNVSDLVANLTLTIAARALFGASVAGDIQTIKYELGIAQKRGNILLRTPLPLYRLAPFIPYLNRPVRSGNVLRQIVQNMIDRRRTQAGAYDDLLSDLMAARDDEDSPGMDDQQLRDEVLTLLLAGHETTMHALSWTFYLLARNPDIQERLRSESQDTRPVSPVGGHESISWAEAVVLEAMRLYPPVYLIGRTAIGPDMLGDYDVPARTNVMINIYGLHRHPTYWDRPNDFRPERMLDSQSWSPKSFTYMPFGAGPRSCIGSRFALIETVAIVTAFSRAFRFEPATSAPIPPSPQVTLKPSAQVILRVERSR